MKITRTGRSHSSEQGASLVEFSLAATVFFLALFGVLEVARLFWIHNTLTDAVRNGARFAAMHKPDAAQVKAVVVYGAATPSANAQPVAAGLTTDQVHVNYSSPFGVKVGAVTVAISGYDFRFAVPVLGRVINLPDYQSTMTAESAGLLP